MASFKERKKLTESNDNNTMDERNNRRGKPQQQIYRPGSGPLRKSNMGIEETESDSNILLNSKQNNQRNFATHDDTWNRSEGSSPRNRISDVESLSNNFGDMTVKEVNKKQRKPEQPIYVPPRAHPRDYNTTQEHFSGGERHATHRDGESKAPNNDRYNSNDRLNTNDRYGNRSKRYSNRRRGNDDKTHNEWRDKSPSVPRHVRQGSEPRGATNGNSWQRSRDTRSVEPSNLNYTNEKMNSKPPSGRRHSTIGLESEKPRYKPQHLDNLPPRLRRKMLAENKLLNQIPSEDNWDGASMTFQGSGNHTVENSSPNRPCLNYATLPAGQVYQSPVQESIYCTMRTRGRGRLQNESFYSNFGAMYHQETPERIFNSPCNSRSGTPTPSCSYRGESNDNLSQDSRPQTPVNYQRNDYHRYNNNRYPDDRYNRNYADDRYKRNNHDRRSQDRFNDRAFEGNKFRNTERSSNSHQDYDTRNKQNTKKTEVNTPTHPQSAIIESLQQHLSPVSPPTPEEKVKTPPMQKLMDNTVLDWSEEVELNDRLESEALSDAITRSSSVTSLVETSTRSMPSTNNNNNNNNNRKAKRKSKKRNRRRSGSKVRDSTPDKLKSSQSSVSRQNSYNNYDNRDKDNFRVPEEPRHRRRRNSRNGRESSFDQFHNKSKSRECSFDRMRRSSTSEHENWREDCKNPNRNSSQREINTGERSRNPSERSRNNSEKEEKGLDVHKGGILVLPQKSPDAATTGKNSLHRERPKYPEAVKPIMSHQKSLYDPNNPSKPIIVKSQSTRVSVPGFSDNTEKSPPQMYYTDQYGNVGPSWYDETYEGFKSCHFKDMVRDIKRADSELQFITNEGLLLLNWGHVENLRHFLREALEYLLCKDLKFCQTENVEQHLWKLIYYNIIEITRKAITTDVANKEQYKGFLLYLFDEGTKYFETLLDRLEITYEFKLSNYIGNNQITLPKGSSYLKLALISAQKILLFLGDLARYRELINETANYGKCRQWYIKAQELNPKNGRPYNQLAVVAVYSRRKLDAVYYYMRSLMSSNPFPSARESLASLFDEIRKKYEQGERKRREERLERARQHMKQKESEDNTSTTSSLRREIWIRPDGGRRVHRTTQAVQEEKDSEEEDLAALSSVEVNKRFVISYLHVHGKLITRIGMESFQEAAMQMLKEFRALLQHSPVPLPFTRFLQLLALNMFAIENTQLKDPQLQLQSGYRSELQERALVVSLQMFNLILERCVSLLQEHMTTHHDHVNSLPQDAHVLLPAIKIWCDWLLCHSSVWNPPPSTQDFRVGTPGDAWSRLAILVNLLKQLDRSSASFPVFIEEDLEGYELVKLPEDSVLSGFTPLMCNVQQPAYASKEIDTELAQFALRLNKLLFFGTEFLCGLEPPVLKLEIEDDFREYVSVVNTSNNSDSPASPRELVNTDDVLESFSSEEDEPAICKANEDAPAEIRDLLTRRNELEKRHKRQELHMQRVKKILSQSVVSVLIEVRPKHLVPDTNCFIDHLDMISTLATSQVYTLMVPIVVLSELEGLGKGGKSPTPAPRSSLDPQHLLKVAESAKNALDFLKCRPSAVKCVTTKGAVLTSTSFTTEDDSSLDNNLKNDDKILSTCLILGKGSQETHQEGEPRKLVQEVVLLTDDRNLRVKALARDVPVRELPDFMQWAGLG